MSKRLTNEMLDAMDDAGDTIVLMGIHVSKAISQAKEANRLREGLKELKYILERNERTPGFYAARDDHLLTRVRKLLEGGE